MRIIEDKNSGVLYRKWEAGASRAVFLLIHGLGAHSDRWGFLAEYFLKKNISSYAIELKGFGETKDRKGHIDSFDTYYRDIASLKKIIQKEHPGEKIFLTGESMGALIAFMYASLYPKSFEGLVGISPAFQSRLPFSVLDYIKIAVFLLCCPQKQIEMPFTSDMCTRDSDYQEVMDSDKREHRFATSRLLREMGIVQLKARARARKLRMPLLFLLAGQDKLVVPAASAFIFERSASADKHIIEYPEMSHALSIDQGRNEVFFDINEWVKERMREDE